MEVSAAQEQPPPLACRCGKTPGDVDSLSCCRCSRRLHLQCLVGLQLPAEQLPFPGDPACQLTCQTCLDAQADSLVRIKGNWSQIVYTALLQLSLSGVAEQGFRAKEDLVPFIERNWDRLCFQKLRTNVGQNVTAALTNYPRLFRSNASGAWALCHVGPWSEPPARGTVKRKSKEEEKPGRKKAPVTRQELPKPPKLPQLMLRALPPEYAPPYDTKATNIWLSRELSAPQIVLVGDYPVEASNDKGHRLVRSSHGASRGDWFVEVQLVRGGAPGGPYAPHARIGWATSHAEAQACAGFDLFSYAFRDHPPSLFHAGKGRTYGEPLELSDILGMRISIPDGPAKPSPPPPLGRKKTPSEDDRCIGSSIQFFRNGLPLSVEPAFLDIFEGTYYACASLYGGAAVTFNFGPSFRHPPADVPYLPMSDLLRIAREKHEEAVREKAAEDAKVVEAMATSASAEPSAMVM